MKSAPSPPDMASLAGISDDDIIACVAHRAHRLPTRRPACPALRAGEDQGRGLRWQYGSAAGIGPGRIPTAFAGMVAIAVAAVIAVAVTFVFSRRQSSPPLPFPPPFPSSSFSLSSSPPPAGGGSRFVLPSAKTWS